MCIEENEYTFRRLLVGLMRGVDGIQCTVYVESRRFHETFMLGVIGTESWHLSVMLIRKV